MTEQWGNQNQGGNLPPLNSPGQQQGQQPQPQYQQPPQQYNQQAQHPQQVPGGYYPPQQPQYQQQPPRPRRGVGLKKTRAWYQKKRFIIPAAFLGFFIFVGAVGSANSPDESLADAPAVVAPAPVAPADPAVVAPAPVVPAAPVAPVAPAPPPAPSETVSQKNALKKAESYLRFSAFSRGDLIDQLVYNQFSTEDATWAVDHVKVDWNEQAAKKAKSYLEFSAFSRGDLIDQLLYNQFTPAQAEYGVSQSGL
jgi:hypothetical protein